MEAAWKRRDALSPFGEGVLGLALHKLKDSRAGELVSKLEQQAKQDEMQAWWPSGHDWLLDFDSDNSVESTALALKLLTARRERHLFQPDCH